VGGDVKAMNEGTGRDTPEGERIAALRARMEASRLLHEMPKPTFAAIEGPAAGAGLSLARLPHLQPDREADHGVR
jgi:2-(1,2-epoxy-1,2-dihydrophenyl)acetyl-CoA isomerase